MWISPAHNSPLLLLKSHHFFSRRVTSPWPPWPRWPRLSLRCVAQGAYEGRVAGQAPVATVAVVAVALGWGNLGPGGIHTP